MIEPLSALRSTLFGCDAPGTKPDPFIESLLSDIRVYSDYEATVTGSGGEYRLKWLAIDSRPMLITLASAYPLEIKPITTFDTFSCKDALGFTAIRASVKDPVRCEVSIKIPTWATALPNSISVPRYSENPR